MSTSRTLAVMVWAMLLLSSSGLHARTDRVQAPAPQPADTEFHFVVLGDAQFHDPALFNRVIDQTRRLRPAFVIQVGDLIEGYTSDIDEVEREWQRFRHQIAPLAPVPFIAIPGNHDVFGGDKKPERELEALYEQHWGPLYFSFTYHNALFVGLNSDSSQAINQIDAKQLRWLTRELGKSDAQHKFVFLHRPPLLMENAETLHTLFKQTGVSHVFYGHHHHYHHLMKDGVAYTMTNAAATSVNKNPLIGGFHHLLQVAVRDADVSVAVIEADAIKPVDAVYPTDNYDMFSMHRRLLPKSVALQPNGNNRYRMNVGIHNTTSRALTLFAACSSADDRWLIEPGVVKPVEVGAGKDASISLQVSFEDNRQPESTPQCDFRVPLQTSKGQWVDFNHTVTTTLPAQLK